MAISLTVDQGALTQVPCYEPHRRGRNWFARITKNPSAPNGLERAFAKRARGEYFYHVPDWAIPGTPVEFGADYYTGAGKPHRKRVYAVLTSVSASCVIVEPYETAEEAITAAEAFADDDDDANPLADVPTDALVAELARRGVAATTEERS